MRKAKKGGYTEEEYMVWVTRQGGQSVRGGAVGPWGIVGGEGAKQGGCRRKAREGQNGGHTEAKGGGVQPPRRGSVPRGGWLAGRFGRGTVLARSLDLLRGGRTAR